MKLDFIKSNNWMFWKWPGDGFHWDRVFRVNCIIKILDVICMILYRNKFICFQNGIFHKILVANSFWSDASIVGRLWAEIQMKTTSFRVQVIYTFEATQHERLIRSNLNFDELYAYTIPAFGTNFSWIGLKVWAKSRSVSKSMQTLHDSKRSHPTEIKLNLQASNCSLKQFSSQINRDKKKPKDENGSMDTRCGMCVSV